MRPESKIGMGIGIKNLREREREIKEEVGGYQYGEGCGVSPALSGNTMYFFMESTRAT